MKNTNSVILYIFIICFTCLLLSCPSDETLDNEIGGTEEQEQLIPNEMEIDSFLWQRPIGQDIASQSSEFFTKHPVLHDGKVIWNIPTSAGFVALDKVDGSTVWDNRGVTNNQWNPEIPKVEGDHLYYVKTSGLRKMNLNTGEIEEGYLWPFQGEHLNRSISIDDGYLYCPIEQSFNYTPEFTEIVRSPLSDLSIESWERFGKRTPEDYDGCSPSYLEAVFHTLDNGNKIIITVDNISCTPTEAFGRLSAIDIDQNKVVWDIIDEAPFQVTDFIYEEGVVFTHSRDYLYAINAENGSVIWKNDLSPNGHDLIISDDYNLNVVSFQGLLVIIGHNDKIMCFHKSSGAVKWSHTFNLTTSREDRESRGSRYGVTNIHNGKLYYRNFGGDIMVLKLESGELRRFHLPEFSEYDDKGSTLFQLGFGRHDIIVDTDGTIYAADGYRFLAFKLPDW